MKLCAGFMIKTLRNWKWKAKNNLTLFLTRRSFSTEAYTETNREPQAA
jgi:hypothetical protein